ncbi:MBL fold metallo-hydrolase [Alicyclobacillus herbarius]|uniref:MBL fold metallo-hydrolase n=1 Tax=Alicyclobacillus herbarius TaxID=122960 RepID=UPI00040A865B|nr:MBL fold metallo-hydrolase [Alicyclobacillus herbarius]
MYPQRLCDTVAVCPIELPTPLPVGPVNVFVLCGKEQCLLVDCGPHYEPAWRALGEGLAHYGFSLSDVTGVVLTHGHVDHVGNTRYFQERGVPVYSHPRVSGWLDPGGAEDQYRADFYRQLYADMGVPPTVAEQALRQLFLFHQWNDRSVVTHPIQEGDRLPPLPAFHVLEVPGHAQAAIALWNDETGDLLIGDQVLPHISPNPIIEPLPGAESGRQAMRSRSLVDSIRTLERLVQLPVEKTYPGHGPVIVDTVPLIKRRLKEAEERKTVVWEHLQRMSPTTAYRLAGVLFPKHADQVSLILSETLGYLDWLLEEGRVHAWQDADGVYWWENH